MVPTVSFVTTTYNRPGYLRECLASIRAQTVSNIEIIIVDDASNSAAMDSLRQDPTFTDVRFLRHHRNQGSGEARRTGVAAARGRYIALHDDDDVWDPTVVDRAIAVMQADSSVALFCCDAVMIDENGAILHDGRTFHEINSAIKRYPIGTGRRTLEDIFLFSTISMATVVRREVFEKTSYPTSRLMEDYEFQLQVAAAGFTVFYLHEPLGKYRIHDGNYSGERWIVRTCKRKVEVLEVALARTPALQRLGRRAQRRVADARMELAIGYAKARDYPRAAWTLFRSLGQDPWQAREIGRLALRWLSRHARQWFKAGTDTVGSKGH